MAGPQLRSLGRLARGLGQALDRIGVAIQGSDAYVERCEWLLVSYERLEQRASLYALVLPA